MSDNLTNYTAIHESRQSKDHRNNSSKSISKNKASTSPNNNTLNNNPYAILPQLSSQLSLLDEDQNKGSTLVHVINKIETKVQNIQVKLSSLTNVVKLLQKYTETKDDQYQKEKENQLFRKSIGERVGSIESMDIEAKIKEFQLLSRQLKHELKNIQKMKQTFGPAEVLSKKQVDNAFKLQKKIEYYEKNQASIQEMEDKLREELNKKMEICLKYFNKLSEDMSASKSKPVVDNFASGYSRQNQQIQFLTDKINQISFVVNRTENECLRNRMLVEKDIENLSSMIKETTHDKATIKNSHSHLILENQSRSQSKNKSVKKILNKSKSINSKSDNSLSKNKNNLSIAMHVNKNSRVSVNEKRKINEEEVREAIKKKKENREKLNKNW